MAGEELLKLFDQNWSERPIFKKDKDPEETKEKRGEPEDQEQEAVMDFPASYLVKRAMSDETIKTSSKTSLFGSSSEDLFLSPRSVLTVRKATPMKLQTILSGKEVKDFSSSEKERTTSDDSEKEEERKKKKSSVMRTTRRGKSMSDLEYEELKGFMDLGFVFSEEDHKDSDLVSILPGLQRLMKKKDDEVVQETEQDINSGNRVSRPYLSEAWDHRGGRKGKKQITPVIKWKVPAAAAANEVDLKDHLKLWAHTVASTIR